MIDELFNKFNSYNMIDWGVIAIGVSGIPGVAERLHHSIIKDFASQELEKMPSDDPLFDVVVGLAAGTDGEDSSELRDSLETICQAKHIDVDNSKRKWRFVLLENSISNLDPDPVYGLIKLSEFWSAWGWPTDAPASMRRNDSKMSSLEYHSQSNYEYVIKDHQEWLVAELALLQ